MVQPGWTNNLEEFFEYEETIGVFVVICVVVIFLAVCTVLFFVGLASIDDDDDDDTNTVTCPACTVDDGTCDAATGVCTCNTCSACSDKEFKCTSGIIQCDDDGSNCTCNNDQVIVKCDGGKITECDADGLNCTCYTAPIDTTSIDTEPIDTEPIDPNLVLWFPMDNDVDGNLQMGSDPDTHGRELSKKINAAYDNEYGAWKFDGTSYLYDLGGDPADDKSEINAYKTVCEGMRNAYTINFWASYAPSALGANKSFMVFSLGEGGDKYSKNSAGIWNNADKVTHMKNSWNGCEMISDKIIPDDKFHMYTFVYDGQHRSAYFDGVFVSGDGASKDNDPCDPLFTLSDVRDEGGELGAGLVVGTSGSSSYFKGYLKDIRLYSTILSDEEIQKLLP